MKTRKTKYTVVEVTDKDTFTLNDLKSLNPTIKVPTLTAYLNKQRKIGRYVSVGKQKLTVGRGKPTNVYKMDKSVVFENKVENKTVMKLETTKSTNTNVKSKVIDNVCDLKTTVVNKFNKNNVNTDAVNRLVDALNDK